MRDLIGYGLYSMIGLAGILLVFTLFSSSETDAQVERVSSEMISLVSGVRKTHRGHPDRYGTGELDYENLIDAGIPPATTVVGVDELQNSFGGVIQVWGIANNSFRVIFDDVPQEVCIQTLSQMRPDERVLGAAVGTTLNAARLAAVTEFPIIFDDAAGLCANDENAVALLAQ